jgi:predicted RNA-binding Zn ribbon-like protein
MVGPQQSGSDSQDKGWTVPATTRRAGGASAVLDPLVATKDLRRAGFPFRSGTPCLDFVATLAKRGMGDRELIGGPAAFATWLRAAELPAVHEPVSAEDVLGVIELREAIHALTRARVDERPLPRKAIQRVNRAAQMGTPSASMALDGETLLPPTAASLASVLAIVARDAIDLFTGRYGHRIRACIGHDCSLFFVDRSRPGSRRWCAMAACGEKASSATYRQRHNGGAAVAHG